VSKINIRLEPTSQQLGLDNGVGQVLANYEKYFSEVDIHIASPGDTYDISASHLGFNVDADVHHNHGLWIGGLERDRAEQNKLIVESIRRAKEVIVPSNYVASYFRRDMRLDPNVVGHGVNWDEWQQAEDRGYILWDKNRRSSVCDPHPVSVLAKAFQNQTFVTTFCENDTPNPNMIVTGRIPFDKMKRIVLGTHIYLATTRETFGIGTLQAMAAGIPVVGYDWGGTSDIVRNGVDGILVKPKDEKALKEALFNVMSSRDVMGEAARERAKQFSWIEVVQQIRSVYDKALTDKQPDVSVIIPAYNYADFLPRAVQSASQQTYDLLKEIIIVDDGSTDDTPDVARQLLKYDNRIRYIRQTNGGVASARNRGISTASTKYVCCLDADDEIAPTYLETVVTELERDKGAQLGYTKLKLVFQNGDTGTGPWPSEFDGDAMLRGENQVPTCCVYEKKVWSRLGGYKGRYCPRGFGAEDAEFWLRFAKFGYRSKLVTEEPLFIYHLGGGTSKDYQEPSWMDWHTDIQTGWLPFAALSSDEIHAVTEYDQPVFSVIIPVGPGHEIYLEDALDSVEAQTDKRWEIIVVWNMRADVLATSDTVDRIHFAYPFVKFICANEKQGAGYARNVGARASRGKYLVFLDADDYLQPKFLEFTRKALEGSNDDWVYTDLYAQTDEKIDVFECYDWDIDKLWRHGIMGVTCLYPRSAFDRVGGFDEEHNREDWDFHMRLAKAGLCGLRLPLPLFTYRQQLGFRREYRKIASTTEESQALKREDVQRIHKLYDLRELKMACSGCGGNRVNIQSASENEMETLIYTGHSKQMANEATFIGPITRTRYRTVKGQIINVHPQDAAAMESNGMFKRAPSVEQGKPIVAEGQRETKVQKPTWKEEVESINAELTDAKNEAREETERMMRELFGEDAMDDTPKVSDENKAPFWQHPSDYTVPQNETFLSNNDIGVEELRVMRDAESENKDRVTLLRTIDEYLEETENGVTIET
jgi:glycosyltransferase involved in cell wall biosynthesis